jgi:methyl-accepting chemotaxis protein
VIAGIADRRCDRFRDRAQEVTSNISGVQRAADDTGTAANQVLGEAEQLSSQSRDLAGKVNRFLSEVGAA